MRTREYHDYRLELEQRRADEYAARHPLYRFFYNDRNYLKGWIANTGYALTVATVTVAVIGGIVYGIYAGTRHTCHRQAAALQTDYQFGWAEGCMFESGGRFVPGDIYRLNEQVGQ